MTGVKSGDCNLKNPCYYLRQHWKGGDSKYMSSNHSEVAAA